MNNACSPLYRRHRFPAEVIAEAVWLYFRFPLSFRMVEDVLAYKGVIVTHKTIRQWAEKLVLSQRFLIEQKCRKIFYIKDLRIA